MAAKIPLLRVGHIMQTVLREVKAAGGEAKLKDLFERAEPKLALSDYERAAHARSGYIRWRSIVHFYSIDCQKAGYLEKRSGRWILTPDGEKALKLPPLDFIQSAIAKYRDWKAKRPAPSEGEGVEETQEDELVRQTAYESAIEQARSEIEDHIASLGWYDFQKLVSELLIAMGYHVPFVAPPGRDGGVDVIAYKDPLGTVAPRIKVQVKHKPETKVSVREVRELEALLRKEGDIGLIVSSGGFTSEVEREIRSSSKHIETMDLDRLIGLWQQYYDKIPEPGKALMPLVKLYFLAPLEE
ncbi:MAG: restriction endonuclease [Bryobacterales bacterium]|nr:restriction endonuclease [Bryobacterales bacterium]